MFASEKMFLIHVTAYVNDHWDFPGGSHEIAHPTRVVQHADEIRLYLQVRHITTCVASVRAAAYKHDIMYILARTARRESTSSSCTVATMSLALRVSVCFVVTYRCKQASIRCCCWYCCCRWHAGFFFARGCICIHGRVRQKRRTVRRKSRLQINLRWWRLALPACEIQKLLRRQRGSLFPPFGAWFSALWTRRIRLRARIDHRRIFIRRIYEDNLLIHDLTRFADLRVRL